MTKPPTEPTTFDDALAETSVEQHPEIEDSDMYLAGGVMEEEEDDTVVRHGSNAPPSGNDSDSDDENDGGDNGKHKRIVMPAWLKDVFNKHINDCRERDQSGLPHLYQQGLFWFPQHSHAFILRDPNLRPEQLLEPRFFLWDPISLVDSIKCICGTSLGRMGQPSTARAMVGLDGISWIIAYRYRCKKCKVPTKSGDSKARTFCSSSSHVLSQLPKHLASEFPAVLTQRRAVSKELLHFIRSCFGSGMGAKQFADALRVQICRRFDETQLRYTQFLIPRLKQPPAHGHYDPGPFPEFSDPLIKAFHAYSPSSQLLQDLYDDFVEFHEPEMDQHMATISLEIGACDHSHKVRCPLDSKV
jgi:hypothetical protein